MKDRQEELSRQAASDELRERCLARQQEQESQLRLQQAEDKHRWQAVQDARRAAKKSERAQSARGRNKALSDIEKLHKATRDDADAFMVILDDIGRESRMLLGGSVARWAADRKAPKCLERLLAEGMTDPTLGPDELRARVGS